MRQKQFRFRNPRGLAVFYLLLALAGLLVIPLALSAVNLMYLYRTQECLNAAADAAALAGAKSISQIVVLDSDVGYLALSNYPPIGKGILAPDGEPLPVASYNQLSGTARLNLLFADQSGSSAIAALAKKDAESILRAGRKLRKALSEALNSGARARMTDIDGAIVDPKRAVQEAIMENLVALPNVSMESLSCSLGALRHSHSSMVHLPRCRNLKNFVIPSREIDQCYEAFVDLPVDGQSFYFVGVSPETRLAQTADFFIPEDNSPASIVRVELSATVKPLIPIAFPTVHLDVASCAVPFSLRRTDPPGNLVVNLYRDPPADLDSLGCLLHILNRQEGFVPPMVAKNGDYPTDQDSQMQTVADDSLSDPATTLYFWMRNLGPDTDLESLSEALGKQFTDITTPNQSKPATIIFESKVDGEITARALPHSPFPIETLSDEQLLTEVNLNSLSGPVQIKIRNHVFRGRDFVRSKHGGQPLAAEPLNWCDLDYFGRSKIDALQYGRGSKYFHLRLAAAANEDTTDGNFVPFWCAEYETANGCKTNVQPRKSFYGSGLACDISLL